MKLKKWLACLLALVSTVSMFACGDSEDSSVSSTDATSSEEGNTPVDGIPEAKNPQDDYTALTEYGTFLHEVNVDFNSPANANFVKDGKSDYKIVLGAEVAKEGMKFTSRHITAKTTYACPEIAESEVTDLSENSTYIFFGCENLYKQAFGEDSMPDYEKIAHTGYSIKTYGKNVFVQAYGLQGYQLGSICLLREILGFDVISQNVTIYERDGSVLPKMDILERPDYDYRQLDKGRLTTDDAMYGMGLQNSRALFIDPGTSWMHNVVDFLGCDPATGKGDYSFVENHRGWFSEDLNKAQGCFTARGDLAEYELMTQRFAEVAIENALKNPNVDNICIGQMDVVSNDREARCGCDACDLAFEYYGSTLSGLMLGFINDVSEKVDEYFARPEVIAENGERDVHVLMLVYGQAIRPPIELTENGTYAEDERGFGVARDRMVAVKGEDGKVTMQPVIDEETGETEKLVAAENVEFLYAASSANYLHSFEEAENDSFSSMVEGWAGLGGSFYVWTYEVNYYNYMYPYNSYDSMLGNMKYFKWIGANHMYYQGLYENLQPTAFDMFRTYICSKGLFDLSVKFEDLVDKWFKYQFGPASDIMKNYFWEVTQHLRAEESVTGGGVHSNQLTKPEVWPEGLIRHWKGTIEEAWTKIEHLKKSDPELWKIYDLNLTAESFFPRYVLCTTYADSFTRTELIELRTAFRDDFLYKCNNTAHREHYTISDVFNTWEFSN